MFQHVISYMFEYCVCKYPRVSFEEVDVLRAHAHMHTQSFNNFQKIRHIVLLLCEVRAEMESKLLQYKTLLK